MTDQTDQQKLDKIIALITFLQHHIQNYVQQSFTDVTFNLEQVVKNFLNVFEKDKEKYENINFLQHNYPAIDLFNKFKDTAIQVTTNADLTKVRKTISTYQKHKIAYSNLIIIGFIKATKAKLPNVNIYGVDYMISLAKHGSSTQKDEVYDILQRQIPLNVLNPLDDKICFDTVFDVINRSAVRDYSVCEGDFNKMTVGLSEVKEIITTGIINGKSQRAKPLVQYTENIKRQLSEIEFDISHILQICNANKNKSGSNFLCLTRQETDKIDELKEQIIDKTNKLSDVFNLKKQIIGSKRY